MDLNTYQIPSKFGVDEEEVYENSSQPSINKLKNFFGDTLLPRISHFCRQGKEVVRFSVDLPNGNPLESDCRRLMTHILSALFLQRKNLAIYSPKCPLV